MITAYRMVSGFIMPERTIGVTEERRILLLKLGFFPVTDDFWYGAGMPWAAGDGHNWAFRTPFLSDKFMPFHETYFENKSDAELRNVVVSLQRALWNIQNGGEKCEMPIQS